MSIEGQKIIPGDEASPAQVLALADEYSRAAEALQKIGKRGKPLTRAPYRLAAIHAIELYLNAFLLTRGKTSSQLRGLNHNLSSRAELAARAGLSLRKKTSAHLVQLCEAREYLIMRYGPEMAGRATNLNRVEATLREISVKVRKHISR